MQTLLRTPLFDRQAPIPSAPQPSTLTPEQQLAIAPVKYPAVWPAPSLPSGTLPTVPLRLLTVAETLTGVILVAWTASFLFMVMRKHWEERLEGKTGGPDGPPGVGRRDAV